MGLRSAVKHYFNEPVDVRLQRFAWGLTGVISVALIVLNWITIDTLSDRTWCTTLTSVEKYLHEGHRSVSSGNIEMILEACRDIGEQQLDHVGFIAKIFAIALGLVPTAVFVVKFAGANASAKFAGGEFSMNGSGRTAGAHEVAEVAEEKAEQIQREEQSKRSETEVME